MGVRGGNRVTVALGVLEDWVTYTGGTGRQLDCVASCT